MALRCVTPVGRWSCYDGECLSSVDFRLGWIMVGLPRLKTPPTMMARYRGGSALRISACAPIGRSDPARDCAGSFLIVMV